MKILLLEIVDYTKILIFLKRSYAKAQISCPIAHYYQHKYN